MCLLYTICIVSGIPTTTYYTGSSDGAEGPDSPVKYHEAAGTNGHDTFSDFVTLVCQEAGQPAPGQPPKSPTKLVSYYSSSMFPPAPTPPMARPVSVKLPDHGDKLVSAHDLTPAHSTISRLSPSSPDTLPRTILYTYSSGGTLSIPEALSPANLSIVQPPRVSSSISKTPVSVSTPTSIRWTTSNGAFISELDTAGISYDLMTPLSDNVSHPGAATISLSDGKAQCLQIKTKPNSPLFSDRYFNTQLEPMDATVGGVTALTPPSPSN